VLLEFTVENYRSYREPAKLSLVASSGDELPENLTGVEDRGLSLLKTVVVYGANGSGKSNLLSAMHFLAALIEAPSRFELSLYSPFVPFGLDPDSAAEPSRMGATFLAGDVLYEYSIAIRVSIIVEEKLVAYPGSRPQIWINRVGEKISTRRGLPLLSQLARTIRPDKLLLGAAAALDVPEMKAPAYWLAGNLRSRQEAGRWPTATAILLGFGWTRSYGEMDTIRRLMQDPAFKSWADAFLRRADLGLIGVEVEHAQVQPSGKAREGLDEADRRQIEEYRPVFLHEGAAGVLARLDLEDESHGTRRLFGMLALFYDVLSRGELAVVDEFSASLHPMIVRELVRLFHDPETNPRGAQLIFTTHDTNLLSDRLFRRDQVWFTEKNRSGATQLYSLHDVKGVRADDAIEKGYLRGRYGAIPFLGVLDLPALSRGSDAE